MIIDNARIENMDCLEFLKTIPDNSTNLVLFDEPYMLLKGHKIEEGYNLDIALQVRTEAMRVLKKDGWLVFFGQFPSAYHFYTKTLEAGFEPWQQCNEIVWCKRSGSSLWGDVNRIHENIFVFTKGKPVVYDNKVPTSDLCVPSYMNGLYSEESLFMIIKQYEKIVKMARAGTYKKEFDSIRMNNNKDNHNNKNDIIYNNMQSSNKYRFEDLSKITSVLSFMPENKKTFNENGINIKHPTVKPILIFCRILKLFTTDGDTILDCFLGSGTTAIATLQCQNRHFVGCERDKAYYDIAVDRCQNWREDLDRQNEWLQERGVMPFNVNDNNKQTDLF
jgi:DNA modification methylase